jgi:hypothetical protein
MLRGRRALVALALAGTGCAAPLLTRDGQVVFSEGGARGASVLTANGVEFMDHNDVPSAVVRRSVNEPWRPATGFLLPADGVWRETSTPSAAEGQGLLLVLRTSDVLVPTWGGEVLVRIDAIVPSSAFPAAAGSVRAPLRLAVIIDGDSAALTELADAALDNLGERDRVTLIDGDRGRTVVPLLPGTHRTLLRGAVERLAQPHRPATRRLAESLELARRWVTAPVADARAPHSAAVARQEPERKVLVVSDGAGVAQAGPRLGAALGALRGAGVAVTVAAPSPVDAEALAPFGGAVIAAGSADDRADAVADLLPPPGDVALRDVAISISSVPAPARVLEISGGSPSLSLDADHLWLGDLYAGEARTEVARVALPVWVAGERLEITVTAHYRDAQSGAPLTASTTLRGLYSADVADIASARHGDVIAYASALAMVRRLDRAFAGSAVDRLGGLRPVVAWQARSLGAMAKLNHDAALGTQAEVLGTLLGAIEE